jgi:hypothetical protein
VKVAEERQSAIDAFSEVAAAYNPKANDLAFGQQRQPGQSRTLSTERKTSSIPNVQILRILLHLFSC